MFTILYLGLAGLYFQERQKKKLVEVGGYGVANGQ